LIVRQCRDVPELEALYRAIGRQFGEEWDVSDRRLDEPRDRFDTDHELMLVLLDGPVIRGGIIAFGDDVVTVRALGIDDELRGQGHGRRLIELVEARALVRGARRLVLGAADDAGGFYERLGYRRQRTMREKELPPPGAVRARLVVRAAAVVDQLSSELLVT
jgi:GNAT superfamily N-acetyltransferase